ncbi:PREDICTED: cell surface glycoprotein MUC18 [Nanorana parkeri]|uniref:cell surface glycoprotein MUC18 n=1 Tax=Nanorana parkeri TaxID=125878 RepID=UPI0008549D17|nr:PREDICTED: cell surface glycoprotein MUC18 [Nanorana parkeri]
MHLLVLISGCLLGCTGVWGQHEHHVNKEEKKVMLGEKVVLPCKVLKPDESATVHWFSVSSENSAENVQKILTAGPNGIIEEPGLKSHFSVKNNSKLVIDNILVEDNKQFLCRVEFKNGVTKESRVQLSVYKAPSEPELKMEQNGLSVTEDAVQIATCESRNGFPMPAIKWYKDNRPLKQGKGAVDIKTHSTTESTGLFTVKSILLAPVQKSDASAFFYCDVSYSLPMGDHMLESERKNITVHYPTTSIKVYFKGQSDMIKEGDTVELSCEGDGNPQPTYTLHKEGDDSFLSEDEPYSWQVSREDTGVYTCKSLDLETGLEWKEQTSLHVHFLDTPVLSHGSPFTVDLQSKLMVSCHVNASTSAVIHWKQDGKNIANGSELNLESVGYNATGVYTCVAELPSVPELQKSNYINITVQGSPQVFVISHVIEVQDGKTVTTRCMAAGHPLPKITWDINGTEVNSSTVINNSKDYEVTSDLTFLVNKGFINQSLTCMAINRFNSSKALIQLLEKPVSQKSYGILIVIVIICILALAVLGAVLYFLYKKGHIPCGRSGKKEITSPGAKDKIIVEMKPDSPAEESVLLAGSQEKKPSDQEKYIDLRN